jgi:hypothetical protein
VARQEIRELRLQVPFPLKVGDVVIGDYVADFVYGTCTAPARTVVEDAKGIKTPLYRWKRKHFAVQYGMEIHEV